MTVVHVINEKSPFWKMSPKDLLNSSFEVIITLDSVIESTGNTTQARTSYLPSEILHGKIGELRAKGCASEAAKHNQEISKWS